MNKTLLTKKKSLIESLSKGEKVEIVKESGSCTGVIKNLESLMDTLMERGLEEKDIDEAVERAGMGDSELFDFRFSDETVDRMEDTVSLSGWDLRNYKRNPVILWDHNASLIPVGRSISTYSTGTELRGIVQFSNSAMAQEIKEAYKGGFLNAVSVGFLPYDWEIMENGYGINFLKQELLETSSVSVPANPEALIEGRKMGLKSFVEAVENRLDSFSEEDLKAALKKKQPPVQFDMKKTLEEDVKREMRSIFEEEFKAQLLATKTRLTGQLD